MESLWCTKKNSIVNLVKDPKNFNPTLTPCLTLQCSMWKNGECFYLRSAGKQRIRGLSVFNGIGGTSVSSEKEHRYKKLFKKDTCFKNGARRGYPHY